MIHKLKRWILLGFAREFITLFEILYFNPNWGYHVWNTGKPIPQNKLVILAHYIGDLDHFIDCIQFDGSPHDVLTYITRKYSKGEEVRVRIYNHRGELQIKRTLIDL